MVCLHEAKKKNTFVYFCPTAPTFLVLTLNFFSYFYTSPVKFMIPFLYTLCKKILKKKNHSLPTYPIFI